MFRLFLNLSLLAALLTSCSASTPVPQPIATSTLKLEPTATIMPTPFRIIAYATEGIIESLIPYDKLTHINYSFLTPQADGTFNPLLNTYGLHQIVNNGHQHNVKVLISVGGWGWDQQFETVAAD